MKRILFLGLLPVIFSMSSCSTDFELEADWKDIPVVYGFISIQDTAHYIRVEKAFLQPGGNANDIAQIADSLYYDNISVEIEKMNSGQSFSLERVDGNLEGYPREEGTFAAAPNYLYKIPAHEIDLDGGEPIRLILNRGDDKDIVTAETFVLNDILPRKTSPSSPMNWGYDRFVTITWNTDENAGIFDLRWMINYRESDPDNPGNFVSKTLEWNLVDDLENEDAEERVSFQIRGEELYLFLKNNISGTGGVIRLFDGMDLYITGAGVELVEFLRVSRANTGITSSQVLPLYTNLSEGLGVFTSRSTGIRLGLKLNGPSLDSLRNGIHTKALNFQ